MQYFYITTINMKYYDFAQRHQDDLGLFHQMPVYEMMNAGHQNERLLTNLKETHLDVNKRPTNQFIVRSNAGYKGANTKRKNKENALNFFGNTVSTLRPYSSPIKMKEYYSP